MCWQIKQEIKQFGINIYQFPECDSDEEEDFKRQDQILKVPHLTPLQSFNHVAFFSVVGCHFFAFLLQNSIPFAVIGSNVQVESKGRKVRGRAYPWGVVEGIVAETSSHARFMNSCVRFAVVARVSGGSGPL